MVKSILHMNRILCFLISSVFITQNCIIAGATSDKEQEEFKTKILSASALLSEAIEKSKSAAMTSLKKEIANNGLDYQLTLMSFENIADPYKTMDFNELIFAYSTAKSYSDSIDTLYNLPFYTIEIEEQEIEQYIPKYVQTYEENEDGTYSLGEKVYIDTPTEIIEVERIGNTTTYKKTGTKIVEPELKTTTYGEVTLKTLDAESILSYFGLSKNIKAKNEYEKKLMQAESIISGLGLAQEYDIKVPIDVWTDELREYVASVLENEDIDIRRRLIISVAKALLGKVPYEWGGKSQKEGYDTSWWTLEYDTGQQKGLDCSGFVQWCFRTAGFDNWEKLVSTQEILKNTVTIPENELQTGDLGLLNNGSELNHVGIYVGDGYWIHCSSSQGTAVMEKTEMFTIFKRMPGIEENLIQTADTEKDTEEITLIADNDIYETDEDTQKLTTEDSEIYLLAQLIAHEARGEGFDGWVAVAEVVKNRILSELFPSTMEEVIYESGQFAGSDDIESMTPTEEIIEVARSVMEGKLEVLGNADVLYFRNAKGSKSDWDGHKWFKEINHHEFYLS